jgi:hypothetical protein
MTRSRAVGLAVALALLMTTAATISPASAKPPASPGYLHPNQTQGKATGPQGAARVAGTNNLQYHGGQVLKAVTNYAIYWQPPTTYMSPSFQTLINRYFGDIGATPLFDLLTQYTGTTGASVNQASFGGSWTDTRAFPLAEGSAANPITDADVQHEVDVALQSNPAWLAPGTNTDYFVFLPRGVYQSYAPGQESFIQYCAYHSSYTSSARSAGTTAYYAAMPYLGTNLAACGDQESTQPNGDADADSEISTISHEQFETVNDPDGTAWWDVSGNEIGDKCAYNFGTVGPDGGNTTLHGHRYIVQQEWSNSDSSCQMRYPGQLTLAAPASTGAGTPFSVTVTAKDASGNTASGYSGTLTFGSSDPLATLPASYTFVAGDQGSHVFSITLNTNGSQTVSATDAVNAVSASASVSVGSPPPPPPAPTLGETVGTNVVHLSWTTSAGATSYSIVRGTSSGGESPLVSGVTSTTYNDSAVTGDSSYYYEVIAVNGSSSSGPSNEVKATPPDAAPTATITKSCSGAKCTFGSSSSDVNTFSWTGGNGLTGTSGSASHTYTTAGTFTVQLTATDSPSGETVSRSTSVTCTTGRRNKLTCH